ncbi:MAG: hypothetical protein M1838_006082 [Thelocarpon superellum]|nr:MAG: hypothetical protein M1838_006082 [Thelocarpon superellum]
MMRVQRRFGKFMPRTADESQVSVLLKDFDDADKLLSKIIDASKSWRDSWVSILGTQFRLVHEYHLLYNPIPGASEAGGALEYAETPDAILERTTKLRELYEELRTELLEEVNQVDARIIGPAMQAKDSIQPMKKVIKKREDHKLDFERYQSRVDNMKKKSKRSERDNISLAKSEKDLARATEEYHAADDHLKSTLPPVITSSFSILPHLLAAQILIQNTLLAQYYTALHQYCEEEGYPSPPPPMEEVIRAWEADFKPAQRELETSISTVASGKAVRQPLKFEDQAGNSITGMNIRNGMSSRRPSNQIAARKPSVSPSRQALPAPPSPSLEQKPAIMGPSPSASSNNLLSPAAYVSDAPSPSPSDQYRAGAGGAHSPAAPRTDYFSRDRMPSDSSTATLSVAAAAAAKAKKPPPPRPPPKRNPSNIGLYVTALYAFDGQNAGDLAFREGDKIRVVKKTDSTDDWWEGELMGKRGSFPANYVQVG